MGKRRLLLVDDNAVFSRVLAEALEAQGFTVDCALQYEDALHRIQQYPPEYALFGQVTSGFDSAVAAMAAARRVVFSFIL